MYSVSKKKERSEEMEVPKEMDAIFDSMSSGLSISLHRPVNGSSETSTPKTSTPKITTRNSDVPITNLVKLNGHASCQDSDKCSSHTLSLSADLVEQECTKVIGRGKLLRTLPTRKPRGGFYSNFSSLSGSGWCVSSDGSVANEHSDFKGRASITKFETTKESRDFHPSTGSSGQVGSLGAVGRGKMMQHCLSIKSGNSLSIDRTSGGVGSQLQQQPLLELQGYQKTKSGGGLGRGKLLEQLMFQESESKLTSVGARSAVKVELEECPVKELVHHASTTNEKSPIGNSVLSYQ